MLHFRHTISANNEVNAPAARAAPILAQIQAGRRPRGTEQPAPQRRGAARPAAGAGAQGPRLWRAARVLRRGPALRLPSAGRERGPAGARRASAERLFTGHSPLRAAGSQNLRQQHGAACWGALAWRQRRGAARNRWGAAPSRWQGDVGARRRAGAAAARQQRQWVADAPRHGRPAAQADRCCGCCGCSCPRQAGHAPAEAPRSGFERFQLQMGLMSAQRMPALVKVSAPVAATGWQKSQPRPTHASSTPRACEHVPVRCWVLDAGGQGLRAPAGCILRCNNRTCQPAEDAQPTAHICCIFMWLLCCTICRPAAAPETGQTTPR
jgi:hypothetical protein